MVEAPELAAAASEPAAGEAGSQRAGGKRLLGLDMLRAIAVLLVMGHHWYQFGEIPPRPLATFLEASWVGVDLFFVLSGFLIGGLLVREYCDTGRVDLRRFLVRRAFRVYPAFWLLIAVSLLADWVGIHPFTVVTPDRLLRELLFVQNYGFGLWNHTWSLGVEEHFYLLLSVAFRLLSRGPPGKLHHRLTLIFGVLFFLVPVLRWYSFPHLPPRFFGLYTFTHLRIDALAYGVFLASLSQREARSTLAAISSRRVPLCLLGIVLVSVCLLGKQTDRLFYSLGVTALYLGFGLIVLCAKDVKRGAPGLQRFPLVWLGWIGQCSYSIYLWHMPVLLWLRPTLRHLLKTMPDTMVLVVLYLALSLIVGFLSTRFVETPLLRLRERLT